MQKYKSNIITTTGLAQRNISVRVLDDNGALAALYADRYGQTPIANPQVTAVDGTFAFYAANGRYSLQTTINGVTYTDQDVVLAADPEDMLVAGPIADAVNSATASVLATATGAASAAQASQNAAAGSQGAAAASESNAADSASAASASAATASGAAGAASASEANAHASENAAATSAGNAATSESNALASKNAAATSAANAASYAQGYVNGGAYAAGITLNDRFTFVAKDNELYRLADSVALPYITTGRWAGESSQFVSIGDRNLRVDLADVSAAAGAALVGYKAPYAGAVNVTQSKFNAALPLDARLFGVVGDGVADDTAALQAWASVDHPRKWLGPGTYKLTAPLTLHPNSSIEGAGAATLIDGSALTSAFVMTISGSYSALPKLQSSTGTTGYVLAFVTSHGLTAGDLVCIYNPADSSFSAARTYYRAGEFARVHDARDAASVRIWGRLHAEYSNTSDCYKVNAISPVFKNFRIKCPNTSEQAGLKISFGSNVLVENVGCFNSRYSGIVLDRCVDSSVKAYAGYATDIASPSAYGITLSNSQNINLEGYFHGSRHAIAVGGDDIVMAVPCRHILVHDSFLSNVTGTDVPAADIHGNAEDIRYSNCVIDGGVALGGLGATYTSCWIRSQRDNGMASMAVQPSEILGGEFVLDNCAIESFGDASTAGSYAPIHLATASYTAFNTQLTIRGCVISAPFVASAQPIIQVRITGNSHVNTKIENTTVNSDGGMLYFQRTDSGTGNAQYCVIDGVTWAPSSVGRYLCYPMTGAAGYANTKFRIQKQSGRCSVVVGSSSPVAVLPAANGAFQFVWPKVPVAQVTVDGTSRSPLQSSGGAVAIPGIYAIAADSIRPAVFSSNAGNFSGTLTYDLCWEAGLNEI